ncbi:MAG TPA: PAS domain S-box protein [Candidatus Sulfotelmatobacter sp.]|nr:PAS domain S-box protein [Terriglobales bacterium]HKT88126.1 PAS domain S-box protein [Candidatus Sulfotelmatobacter sp.]
MSSQPNIRHPHQDPLDANFYSRILNSLDAIIWEADARTFQFRFVSPQAERILGFPAEQWIAEPDFWRKHTHPDDVEWCAAFCRDCTTRGVDHVFEYRMVGADDRVVWLRDVVTVVSEPGEHLVLRGLMLDITERKRAEENLTRISTAIEHSSDGIVIADPPGNSLYHNPAFIQLTGYDAESIKPIGGFPALIIEPAMQEQIRAADRAGSSWRGEVPLRTKQGRTKVVCVTRDAIRDSQNRVLGVVSVCEDQTERREMEHQIRHAQKMDAVGRLAGGIAHDFNNLLNVIGGYGELALMRLQSDHPITPYLQGIRQAVERGGSLTRHLLAFSRQQLLEPTVLNLNQVVEEMSEMLRRVIGPTIEFFTFFDSRLKLIKVDRGELEHLLMNLVVNARDAMPNGGRLEIRTANTTIDTRNSVALAHRAQPGAYVSLSIRDSGMGMDANTQQRIFEPFFTTKEFGKGTGLGLSIVYGIVQQSGGFITVQSELGQGSTFEVYLPQAAGIAHPAHHDENAVDREKAQHGTILVVEDEAALRELTREALVARGYDVLEAPNGNEALAVCESHSGPIDLMITDVVMPKMRGDDLAQRVKELHPEVRILFTSGYTATSVAETIEDAAFLQKPYRFRDLAERIRDILDQSRHEQNRRR